MAHYDCFGALSLPSLPGAEPPRPALPSRDEDRGSVPPMAAPTPMAPRAPTLQARPPAPTPMAPRVPAPPRATPALPPKLPPRPARPTPMQAAARAASAKARENDLRRQAAEAARAARVAQEIARRRQDEIPRLKKCVTLCAIQYQSAKKHLAAVRAERAPSALDLVKMIAKDYREKAEKARDAAAAATRRGDLLRASQEAQRAAQALANATRTIPFPQDMAAKMAEWQKGHDMRLLKAQTALQRAKQACVAARASLERAMRVAVEAAQAPAQQMLPIIVAELKVAKAETAAETQAAADAGVPPAQLPPTTPPPAEVAADAQTETVAKEAEVVAEQTTAVAESSAKEADAAAVDAGVAAPGEPPPAPATTDVPPAALEQAAKDAADVVNEAVGAKPGSILPVLAIAGVVGYFFFRKD